MNFAENCQVVAEYEHKWTKSKKFFIYDDEVRERERERKRERDQEVTKLTECGERKKQLEYNLRKSKAKFDGIYTKLREENLKLAGENMQLRGENMQLRAKINRCVHLSPNRSFFDFGWKHFVTIFSFCRATPAIQDSNATKETYGGSEKRRCPICFTVFLPQCKPKSRRNHMKLCKRRQKKKDLNN